ncbi:11201_t:CDS:2, partial [Ambispora leptoticha]
NEKAELHIKQIELQFIIDRLISNNKVHDHIEEQKLDLISKRSKRALDRGSENNEKADTNEMIHL